MFASHCDVQMHAKCLIPSSPYFKRIVSFFSNKLCTLFSAAGLYTNILKMLQDNYPNMLKRTYIINGNEHFKLQFIVK